MFTLFPGHHCLIDYCVLVQRNDKLPGRRRGRIVISVYRRCSTAAAQAEQHYAGGPRGAAPVQGIAPCTLPLNPSQ